MNKPTHNWGLHGRRAQRLTDARVKVYKQALPGPELPPSGIFSLCSAPRVRAAPQFDDDLHSVPFGNSCPLQSPPRSPHPYSGGSHKGDCMRRLVGEHMTCLHAIHSSRHVATCGSCRRHEHEGSYWSAEKRPAQVRAVRSFQTGSLFSASPLTPFLLSSDLVVDYTYCCFVWEVGTRRERVSLGLPSPRTPPVGMAVTVRWRGWAINRRAAWLARCLAVGGLPEQWRSCCAGGGITAQLNSNAFGA